MRADRALIASLHPDARQLPIEGELASLEGATDWLNSGPLTPGGLRGKVVLVQFWTYTCINWLRTLPYVRAWADRYKEGLVVVGVHTPEFTFENDIDNVRMAVRDMNIQYPVAIDSDYVIWRAFDNHYWPALYFADAEGRLRHHRFGEGEYEMSEMVIQRLLTEAGLGDVDDDLVSIDPQGVEVAADWANLESPENYLGYERTQNLVSPGGVAYDESEAYSTPPDLRLNQWALSGRWTVAGEFSEVLDPGGSLSCRFRARDLHMVMGPATRGSAVGFRVLIDGEPPGRAHGGDVDVEGNGMVTDQRLYQLIRQPGAVGEHTFQIVFLDPGARVYAFTFG
jgi:thiol-disulfide isomerase/thioredoxin